MILAMHLVLAPALFTAWVTLNAWRDLKRSCGTAPALQQILPALAGVAWASGAGEGAAGKT